MICFVDERPDIGNSAIYILREFDEKLKKGLKEIVENRNTELSECWTKIDTTLSGIMKHLDIKLDLPFKDLIEVGCQSIPIIYGHFQNTYSPHGLENIRLTCCKAEEFGCWGWQ